MSKKYYTYNSDDLRKMRNTISFPNPLRKFMNNDTAIIFHPDHIDVLDIEFDVGDLVETCDRRLGIIVENLGRRKDDGHRTYIPCDTYRVQVGTDSEKWLAISLKKIKK